MKREKEEVFNYPLRRRLVVCAAAYLAGVYFASVGFLLQNIAGVISVLFAFAGFICRAKRRNAFLFLVLFLLCFGVWRTQKLLGVTDLPTQKGVLISGTVSGVEYDYRVRLDDVVLGDGTKLNRPVIVTLMREEGSHIPSPGIGQSITGTGRLFAQDQKRNPGGVDWRLDALADGYELSGYMLPGWKAEGEERISPAELFRRMRVFLMERLEEIFGEHAAVFGAMLLGDKRGVSKDTIKWMRLTGIVHILTVSGVHMMFIAGALDFLISRLRMGRYGQFMIKAVSLGFYACLTGGSAGTIRALVMTLIREWGRVRGKQYDSLTALAAAALCISMYNPMIALDASFQFSFFIVLGIILIGQTVVRYARQFMPENRLVRRIAGGLGICVAAQAASLPLQLMFYGYIPVLALPMNMICSMTAPLFMFGGWAALMASFVSVSAGHAAAGVIGACFGWLDRLSSADLSQFVLRMPSPSGLTIFLFAVFMLACSDVMYIKKRRACAVLVCAVLVAGSYAPRLSFPARYAQLDVGQGDCAVLSSGRHAVVVDVGAQDCYELLRYLRHEGLMVSCIFLSHLDVDHAGGLGVLLDSEIRIGQIVLGEDEQQADAEMIDLIVLARRHGIPVVYAKEGDRFSFGEIGVRVVAADTQSTQSNARSMVLHMHAHGVSFLMTGDLPAENEPASLPSCDVLKAAHHGSRYATSERLIVMVNPDIALISVGENSYGHPSQRVLDDLARHGVSVYRTDESGCILLYLRDGEYTVKTLL